MPANYAKAREWRRGDSEEWPTGYAGDTELGTRGGKPRKRKRRRSFLTTKHTNETKREAEEGGDDGKTKGGLRGCGG